MKREFKQRWYINTLLPTDNHLSPQHYKYVLREREREREREISTNRTGDVMVRVCDWGEVDRS